MNDYPFNDEKEAPEPGALQMKLRDVHLELLDIILVHHQELNVFDWHQIHRALELVEQVLKDRSPPAAS